MTCVYLGACHINNGGCSMLAACVEMANIVRCFCPPGYTGTGVGPMGCTPGGGGAVGPVAPTPAPDHPILSPCASAPCLNGGTCIPAASGQFSCQCSHGWSGARCHERQDWCSSSPCQNGATCINTDLGFSCECSSGFTGQACQEEVNLC